jgi:hypothetical protein
MKNQFLKNAFLHCIIGFISLKAMAGTIMFENANQLFRNKNYIEASELYMQIINDGYGSCSVYYNAGNAFYKSNKMGYAVWCYNKALQYEQNNKLVLDNLALTKKQILGGDSEQNGFSFFKKMQELLNYFPLNTWAFYSWLLFILVILFRAIRLIKNAPVFLIGLRKLFFAIFLLVFPITLCNYFLNKYNKLAIVVQSSLPYQLPMESGITNTLLIEGTQVIIKDAKKNTSAEFQKIKLPNGKICWVSKNSIKTL